MAAKLVSSDLNGTLVHQHTMGDMIRLYIGKEQFRRADEVFKRQINGTATMEEAFSIAAPLTKELTLRQAITYTQEHMKYVDGFEEFVDWLRDNNVPLVINSTGYSVTIYSIRERFGRDKIHGQIGNKLLFGLEGDSRATLREDELERIVRNFFQKPESRKSPEYDRIKATGSVVLGIREEVAKAKLINQYVRIHFPEVKPDQIVHMGDTMGDSRGILDVARQGGQA